MFILGNHCSDNNYSPCSALAYGKAGVAQVLLGLFAQTDELLSAPFGTLHHIPQPVGSRGVDLEVLVQGTGPRCGAPAGASPPGGPLGWGPLGGVLTRCSAHRRRTPVTVILVGTRRPRAICLGPLQSGGFGKGCGFFCKYVVGVVDKPSAAVGKEAAQDEKKKSAAKGHKYRPRVKGHEILAPRTGPAAFREAICI